MKKNYAIITICTLLILSPFVCLGFSDYRRTPAGGLINNSPEITIKIDPTDCDYPESNGTFQIWISSGGDQSEYSSYITDLPTTTTNFSFSAWQSWDIVGFGDLPAGIWGYVFLLCPVNVGFFEIETIETGGFTLSYPEVGWFGSDFTAKVGEKVTGTFNALQTALILLAGLILGMWIIDFLTELIANRTFNKKKDKFYQDYPHLK